MYKLINTILNKTKSKVFSLERLYEFCISFLARLEVAEKFVVVGWWWGGVVVVQAKFRVQL